MMRGTNIQPSNNKTAGDIINRAAIRDDLVDNSPFPLLI
jgi:hypothetical protein